MRQLLVTMMVEEEEPPFESFSCPITGALMEDPVMTIGACVRRSGWGVWMGWNGIDPAAWTDTIDQPSLNPL